MGCDCIDSFENKLSSIIISIGGGTRGRGAWRLEPPPKFLKGRLSPPPKVNDDDACIIGVVLFRTTFYNLFLL